SASPRSWWEAGAGGLQRRPPLPHPVLHDEAASPPGDPPGQGVSVRVQPPLVCHGGSCSLWGGEPEVPTLIPGRAPIGAPVLVRSLPRQPPRVAMATVKEVMSGCVTLSDLGFLSQHRPPQKYESSPR